MLTPKETGGGGPIYPYPFQYSALVESEYTNATPLPENITFALGFKPLTPIKAPLNDVTGHYPITLRKAGDTLTAYNGLVEIDSIAVTDDATISLTDIGSFLSTVIARYAGSWQGYYSRLVVVPEHSLGPESFWEMSQRVTGLVVPKEYQPAPTRHPFKIDGALGAPYHDFLYRTERAFDGTTAYTYTTCARSDTGRNTAYIGKDWGGGSAKAVHKVVLHPATNAAFFYGNNSADVTLTLQGSNDAATWADLGSAVSDEEVGNEGDIITIESSDTVTPYRYVRVHYASAETGYALVADMEIHESRLSAFGEGGGIIDFSDASNLGRFRDDETIPQPSLWVTGGTATESTRLSSLFDADEAFDGSYETTGSDNAWLAANSDTDQWIQYEFPAAKVIDKFGLIPRTAVMGRVPTAGTLEGSNDGTNWTQLDTWAEESTGGLYRILENPGSYSIYRMRITATLDGSTAGIHELKYYEQQPDDYPTAWTIAGTQTLDTLTNNFATLNPLSTLDDGSIAYGQGNLARNCSSGAGFEWAVGTQVLPKTGKWAWREYVVSSGSGYTVSGITKVGTEATIYPGSGPDAWGATVVSPAKPVPTDSTYLYDADEGTFQILTNGLNQIIFNNAVSAVGPVAIDTSQDMVPIFGKRYQTDTAFSVVDFGSNGWTPPEGYKLLCQSEMPYPAILKSASVADIVLRLGNGNLIDRTAGTVISHNQRSDRDPAIAFDGTIAQSVAQCAQSEPGAETDAYRFWIGKDFGTEDKQAVSQAIWYGPTDGGITNILDGPYTLFLEGCDDEGTWHTLGSTTWSDVVNNDVRTVASDNTETLWTGLRMMLESPVDNDGYVNCAELEFYCPPARTVAPDMEFGPDFVNIKDRDAAGSWSLYDTLRSDGKRLRTDVPDAEETLTGAAATALDGTGGYSVGTLPGENQAGSRFIDLCLTAGVPQGFEIVSYTGDGVSGRQIAHSLGKAPTFILLKCLDEPHGWPVYHAALGRTLGLWLSENTAAQNNGDLWWPADPSATHVTVGSADEVNQSGKRFVAYLFTDSDVFQAFSYTGNGSVDGPFVNLGGKPLALPFLKSTGQAVSWLNIDAVRNPKNTLGEALFPDLDNPESAYYGFNLTSSGFKVSTADTTANQAGELVAGLAILESTHYNNAF